MTSATPSRRNPATTALVAENRDPTGPSSTANIPSREPADRERIAKRLARVGLCSRRDAERWVAAGRVAVNGRVLTSPAVAVGPADDILVDGASLPKAERTRLWRHHKPAGVVTTARDPQGRPTVFGRLPGSLPRTIAVGRLDLNSEGLLLLTNDGELARRLELPETGWTRRYRVRAHGTPTPTALERLAEGVRVDGIDYGAIHVVLDRQQGANAWLTVALKEGRNREIRIVMAHLGLTVNRLIRTAYGPFQLGGLDVGGVAEVSAKTLREQLGGTTHGWARTEARPAHKNADKATGASPGGRNGPRKESGKRSRQSRDTDAAP